MITMYNFLTLLTPLSVYLHSPGSSAKYYTYSLMDDSSNQVVHFELVQVSVHADKLSICMYSQHGRKCSFPYQLLLVELLLV